MVEGSGSRDEEYSATVSDRSAQVSKKSLLCRRVYEQAIILAVSRAHFFVELESRVAFQTI